MSDVPQGEGWWQASDGKWYAPEQHPNYRPPPPPVGSAPSNPPAWTSSSPFPGTHPGYGAPPGYYPSQGHPPYSMPGPPAYGHPPTGWTDTTSGVFLDPVLHQPLAPWWKRFVAILIDGAVLGLAYFVIILIIGALASNGSSSSSSSSSSNSPGAVAAGLIALWIIFTIPAAVYYGAMNGSRRGQTLGKMALSIAVRDARSGSSKIGFWRALGRFLITVLFSIPADIPYIIDSLSPLWDSRRQSWHDKVAHTVVIDLNP